MNGYASRSEAYVVRLVQRNIRLARKCSNTSEFNNTNDILKTGFRYLNSILFGKFILDFVCVI